MGSSGSGRISDYPGSSSPSKTGGSSGNGSGAIDRCTRAFSARLEDVEQCEYFRRLGQIPPVGTQLIVAQRKRLVAQTEGGESVGYLPTSFNYLAACMKGGWAYIGRVQRATSGPPVISISADFLAMGPK